jgi:hypothetical protein
LVSWDNIGLPQRDRGDYHYSFAVRALLPEKSSERAFPMVI